MQQYKIVTHARQAHRDEFLACCFLMAERNITRIERRDCTDADLESLDTIVVDQGQQYDDYKLNFDHHHFDRNAEACCALTLVMQYLGFKKDYCRDVLAWFEFSEILDSKGPVAAAKYLEMPLDNLFKTISPVETQMLKHFESFEVVDKSLMLYYHMQMIGQNYIDYLQAFSNRIDELRDFAKVIKVQELDVIDVTFVDRANDPTLALEHFIKKHCPSVAVTVTQDNDKTHMGYALYRRDDHPNFDFSKLEGHPQVHFAHKGGFIAKTTADADWKALVESAIV